MGAGKRRWTPGPENDDRFSIWISDDRPRWLLTVRRIVAGQYMALVGSGGTSQIVNPPGENYPTRMDAFKAGKARVEVEARF